MPASSGVICQKGLTKGLAMFLSQMKKETLNVKIFLFSELTDIHKVMTSWALGVLSSSRKSDQSIFKKNKLKPN